MIHYYLDRVDAIEDRNDSFFKTHTYQKVLHDIELRNIVEEVEQVSFDTEGKIISKLNGNHISLSYISTGCKTLLNILAYKDKIFSIQECGFNVINKLFTYEDISFYCNKLLVPDIEFTTKVILHYKQEEIAFNSLKEMEDYYYDIYTKNN